MAILTAKELSALRRKLAVEQSKIDGSVTWSKSDINAALQAIENWYEGEKPTVSGLIDTATSPFVFTNAQKKKLAGYYLELKFRKEVA